MCILYGVVAKDRTDGRPWMMAGLREVAEAYAQETNGTVIEKVVPTPRVRLPIPKDAKVALKAVEEHTNIMMANRKAGKAVSSPAEAKSLIIVGNDGARRPSAGVDDLDAEGSATAPDTDKPLNAGKADVILPGPEDGAVAVRPVSRSARAGVCKKSDREGSSVPAEGIVLSHESGGQSVKDAPAPDTETPSVFPLNELDRLKMDIANLEEYIKDLKFELNDKDITIKALEHEIGKLKGQIAGGVA